MEEEIQPSDSVEPGQQTPEVLADLVPDMEKELADRRKEVREDTLARLVAIDILTSDDLKEAAKLLEGPPIGVCMRYAGMWGKQEQDEGMASVQLANSTDQSRLVSCVRGKVSTQRIGHCTEAQEESAERRRRQRIKKDKKKKEKKNRSH
jgi:hypothetical protein